MPDNGMSRLAKVLHERMKSQQDAHSELTIDTGTILPDMSLLTDSFPIPIPQKDYYVNQLLTLGPKDDVLTESHVKKDGSHDHPPCGAPSSAGHYGNGAHDHDIKIPEKMRWLQPGDRVLVNWVHNDAFVIMRFVPATEIS